VTARLPASDAQAHENNGVNRRGSVDGGIAQHVSFFA
jgi:hypothetical protein